MKSAEGRYEKAVQIRRVRLVFKNLALVCPQTLSLSKVPAALDSF